MVPTLAQNAGKNVALRIMPLGASVTFGVGSTTGDSYRKDLRDMLSKSGMEVNMVGQKKNGNFADNDVEATPGFTIAQIANSSKQAAPMFKPNLVLVDAGTNNCNNGGTQPQAGQQVEDMINQIYAASPGATVILATILQTKVANQDACRVDINKQYQTIAAQFAQKGAKFALVDMRSGGPTVNDLADQRHPNDAGYQKMANVWQKGIQEVMGKGFLAAPAGNGVPLNGDDATPAAAGSSGSLQQGQTGVDSKTTTGGAAARFPSLAGLALAIVGAMVVLA